MVFVQSTPFFPSSCPRCRRIANRAIDYLARSVRCRHCGQIHLAIPRESGSASQEELITDWSRYVALLQPEVAAQSTTPLQPR